MRKDSNKIKNKKQQGQKKFTVQNAEVNKTVTYGDFVADDKIVSSDRTENKKIIITTFTGNSNLSQPDKIDVFIQNSMELAENGKSFIPWIESENCVDPFINEAIRNSGLEKEFKDEIGTSDILDLSNNSDLEVL